MIITKSMDPQSKPSVVMMVYGAGGVGKTTFSATAPKPLLVDCENGAKYFGLRGISLDVAKISRWEDLEGIFDIAKSGEYETIIIDPIGELMEKLKRYMIMKGDRKLVQSDGSPSMAGWGFLKDTMRSTIKILRDSGVNLLLVAHIDEKADEDQIVKRPMIMTKISEELVNMVDIVGYMTVTQVDGEEKRIIIVDPTSDKYVAKDRTGQLGKIIPPNFQEIIHACQGTKQYAWSNKEVVAKTADKKAKAENGEVDEADLPATLPTPSEDKGSVEDKLATAGAKKKAIEKKAPAKKKEGLKPISEVIGDIKI